MTVTEAGSQSTGDVRLYRIPKVMQLLDLSRSVIYELMNSGRLRSVKQGRARLVPASAIAEYVALLEREAADRSGLRARRENQEAGS